jgi:hypothetical protein
LSFVFMGMFAAMAGQEGQPVSFRPVGFDIPAQPLADALVAYGAATGVEVYYDGTLALGRRSAAVKGVFTPAAALKVLLQGSGYVPRTAGTDTFTLAAELPATSPPVQASNTLIRRYEPYFAALQTRVVDALCGIDTARRDEIIFSFWVDASGVISRSEILGASDDAVRNAFISKELRGLSIGAPPPSSLPQPVTMVIYPPSAGEASGCAAAAGSRMGN